MNHTINEIWDQVLSRNPIAESVRQLIVGILSSKDNVESRTNNLCLYGTLEVRILAAQVLGQIHDDWALTTLLSTFQDQREDVILRRVCGYALGWQGNKKAIPVLISVLKNDPVTDSRNTAAYSLGLFPPTKKIVDVLTGIVANDAEAAIRARAAESMGALGSKRAVPTLIGALEDPNVDVRFFAIRALAWIRDSRALPALERLAITDEEVCAIMPDGGTIRDEAAEAIERIKSSRES